MDNAEQSEGVCEPSSQPDEDPRPSGTPSPAAEECDRLRGLLEEARRSERTARGAVSLLTSIIDQLPVALTVRADDGTVLLANHMAGQLSDAAHPCAETISPAATAGEPASEGAAANREAPVTIEERAAGNAGERTLLTSSRSVRILQRPLVLSTALDFTARKQAELELSKRAYFDDLTGLPNRVLIQEHVEHLLAPGDRRTRFALAFLDIDNFKHINDYYTHTIGDALLVKVAQRIADQIRPLDVLGRISGDEFLLVLDPIASDEELDQLIDTLLAQLKEPFFVEGFEVLTSASIGVSVYPDHGINYEVLRRSADIAMYRIKDGTKGGAALFDTAMGRAITVRMAQEQRLRLAVRDSRFCCAFQPKVDIRTQQVVGVEALIRLRDEDGVIQGPGEFVALAVELGLIGDLTHLALAEIVRSMDLLDEAFGQDSTISINIAAKQAGDHNFMAEFCEELRSTTYANRFMVEVTEDAFLAKSRFQTHVVPMLRNIGTRVSVDDFGTGYSSLAALADITADEIKIDRSFITGIHERPRSQSVLKAIEALGEALGMTVIAEGVETFEELAYLQAATRIRFAQGYYFAKPMLLEDLAPMRQAERSRSGRTRNQPPLRRNRMGRL